MSVIFTWEERYSVGVGEIDAQHKRMFELANSIDSRVSEDQIKRTVVDLYKYTREHFDSEETLMKGLNYSKYGDHVALHENLITLLNEKSARIYDSEEALFAFKKFVYDWLIDHILSKDIDFFDFVQKKSGL